MAKVPVNEKKQTILQQWILPASYIPVILVFTLVYLLSYSSNANIDINKTICRYLWYAVIVLLTTYPLYSSIRYGIHKKIERPFGRTIQNCILFSGILTSHIVTAYALYTGEIKADKFLLLLMYDLIIIGSWYYWTFEKKGFEAGLEILAVLLWISALYGISEHFFYGKMPSLYRNISNGMRVISVFANTIPASSMWLMGMWMPFPGTKKHLWASALVKMTYAVAVFFAGGKNGWLGLAVSGIIGLTLFIKEKLNSGDARKIRRTLLVTGIVLVVGIILVSKYDDYFEYVMIRLDNVQTQSSFLARLQHIQDTIQYMLSADPLRKIFGFGYATSWQFVEDSPHYYGLSVRCIDNQFFTSLFEFGLSSLICIVILVCRLIAHLKDEDRFIRGASFGLLAMMVPLWSYDAFRWEIVMAMFLPLSMIMLTGEPVSVPWKKVVSLIATLAAAACAGWFLIPKAIRSFRTLSQHYAVRLHLQPNTFELLFLAVSAMIAAVVFVTAYFLVSRGKTGKRTGIKIGLLCFGLITGGVLAAGTYVLLQRQMKYHTEVLNHDAPAMELIVSSAGGKVVVDEDPSLYQLRFGGISPEFYRGASIIRADETTLVTDRNYEAKDLLNIGFLFTEISEHHAVYTDDPAVQEALEKNGYHLTGYYNIERTAILHAVEEAAAEGTDSGMDSASDFCDLRVFRSEPLYLYPGIYTATVTSKMDGDAEEAPVLQAKKSSTLELMGSAQSMTLKFAVTATSAAVDGKEPVCMEILTSAENSNQYEEPSVSVVQTPDWDVHATYDYGDHKILEEFYTLSGEKTLGTEGSYAIAYKYDRRLLVQEKSYLDTDGQLMLNTSGYAKVINRNGKYGPVKVSYFGKDEEPICITNGTCIEKRTYDAYGNVVKNEYFDTQKQPVLINAGYSVLRRKFDSQHHILREAYLGTDGKRIALPSRVAIQKQEYDSSGKVAAYRYYGVKKQPVLNTSSYAQIRYTYNEQRYIGQQNYYDTEGNPITGSDGSAGLSYERDVRGNAVKTTWLDKNGDPVLNTSGYAMMRRTFDAHNRIMEEAYFDEAENPVLLSSGYALEKKAYDIFGNLISRTFCDADGKPVLNSSGYSQVCYTYNAQKMVTEEAYYDTEGRPVLCSGGYSAIGYVRNSRGGAAEITYYDLKHDPVINTSGYAIVRRMYDANNWMIREEYAGTDGSLIELGKGQAAEERDYDRTGNIISRRYYGADGKPVMIADGYAQVQYENNRERMAVKESYYDIEGNLVLLPEGYASLTYERDDRGLATEISYYGLEGEPVINASGYARLNREYDECSRIIREEYRGTDEKPIIIDEGYATAYYEYNAARQIIKECYFGTQGESIMISAGYASVIREYGEDGALISEIWYDDQGKEILR